MEGHSQDTKERWAAKKGRGGQGITHPWAMDWAAGESQSSSDLSCTGSQAPPGRMILRASSGPEGQGSGPDSFFVRGRDRALEKGQSGIRDQFCRLSTRGSKFLKFSSLHFLTCGDGRQGSLYQDPPFQGLTPHFQGRSWESGGEDCQPLTLGPCRGRTALGRTPALRLGVRDAASQSL